MGREASGVATRWYDLGVELLDSKTAVRDVMKTSHHCDDDQCSEMIKTWLYLKPVELTSYSADYYWNKCNSRKCYSICTARPVYYT